MIIQLLKKLFGYSGSKDAENMIRIAFMEDKIDREEIDLINRDIDGISINLSELKLDQSQLSRMKMALPAKNYQKFKLIHHLVNRFCNSEKYSEEHQQILVEIISVIQHERSRVNEMIDSMKSNITTGNSLGEAYSRLGYLLRPRQVNFN